MTATLYNSKQKPIPARPTLCDKNTMRSVVDDALDTVFAKNATSFDETEKDNLFASLADHYHQHCDVYELGKDFERDGWDVDKQFIDDLEVLDAYIASAFDNVVKKWGEAYQPQPPIAIGNTLSLTDLEGKLTTGVITGLSDYEPGVYLVKVAGTADDDTTRRLIRFEDATESENSQTTH